MEHESYIRTIAVVATFGPPDGSLQAPERATSCRAAVDGPRLSIVIHALDPITEGSAPSAFGRLTNSNRNDMKSAAFHHGGEGQTAR